MRAQFCVYTCALLLAGAHGCTGLFADNVKLNLRTHVWGCPIFVLEPKFQYGKNITKWKRQLQIGQFMGFLREIIPWLFWTKIPTLFM